MADISAWSPVDESNTAAPPNGWPEYMQNSMVNNCARAMMGAIRRFYDSVISGSILLPYLPIGGGSLSGSLSATEYKLSSVNFAQRSTANNWHAIYDGDGFDPALILGGAAAGYLNDYRAETHRFVSNSGAATFATINAAGVSTPGTVSAAVLSAVNVFASGNIGATGTVTGNAVNSNGNAGVAGTMTATAVVGDTVHANTTLSAGTSVAAPTIAASGTLSGGNVAASNSVTAGTFVDAPQYRLAGVPVSFATTTALEALEARIAALEAA